MVQLNGKECQFGDINKQKY